LKSEYGIAGQVYIGCTDMDKGMGIAPDMMRSTTGKNWI